MAVRPFSHGSKLDCEKAAIIWPKSASKFSSTVAYARALVVLPRNTTTTHTNGGGSCGFFERFGPVTSHAPRARLLRRCCFARVRHVALALATRWGWRCLNQRWRWG